MCYSSGFGACYVVKSVSTDCTPPACPVHTEYQWHKCAGQAPRCFSSSAVLQTLPRAGAVLCLLLRAPSSRHWILHPPGINCLPDCLNNQEAYSNVVCPLPCYHNDFGVLEVFICLLVFGLVFFCILNFFRFNRNKWGIFTFGDNQAKITIWQPNPPSERNSLQTFSWLFAKTQCSWEAYPWHIWWFFLMEKASKENNVQKSQTVA